MKIAGVVLAAGLGTRMNSHLPKVLHLLNGVPMLQYVIDTLSGLKPESIVTVVGKYAGQISSVIQGPRTLVYAEQREPKGTGDALLRAVPFVRNFYGTILVVNGDTPLLTAATIRKFLLRHRKSGNDISLLSFMASDPVSYGRLLRDGKGEIAAIVEDSEATEVQRQVREVNSGVYAIEPQALRLLKEIRISGAKKEYYLTDIVSIAKEKGMPVGAFCAASEDEFVGVNTRKDLERAGRLMRRRIVERWSDRGVDFIDPGSVFISASSVIGSRTIVYPNVHIEGATTIGRGCVIYPNVRIVDSAVGDNAIVKDSTLVEKSTLKKGASVGPFAHIRPGCTIGERAKIGNFVEMKNSEIGPDTKASHLSYLGDAKVGKGVNIGAGTITCNYDGFHKYVTFIEDGVFIGSDSQLIAPVKIARGAVVGAGSTITENVPAQALALSRVPQTNVEGWALRRQQKDRRKHAADSRQGKYGGRNKDGG